VLADLTGVPDFYSMMGAFVRSVVPIPAWKGSKLPPLRRWVRVVFAIYTVIGLPGMIAFLVILLMRVPTVYRMTWDAMRVQLDSVPTSWQQADWMMLAAELSQMLILCVTMIGLAWFLIILSRTYLGLMWKLARYLKQRMWPTPQPAV
jgi:putative peptide zinc metalloprotease protein